MARKVDHVGQEVATLRLGNDGSPAAFARIRAALRSNEQRMVVAAAQLAGPSGESPFAPDLVETFERLVAGGQSADPLCRAKEAVLAALTELGHDNPEIYLQGLRLRQYDPAYGVPPPGEETGGGVRSISALKLPTAGLSTEDLIRTLAPMLFDSSQNVVRSLAGCQYWESILLLELKVMMGDSDAGVLGECFIGLLNADFDRHLPVVAEHLDDFNSEVRLQAICTLSECRSPRGVETLIAWFSPLTDFSDVVQGYLALGRSRHELAREFLQGQSLNGSSPEQALAIRALAQRT
jgi:hypothetical protein